LLAKNTLHKVDHPKRPNCFWQNGRHRMRAVETQAITEMRGWFCSTVVLQQQCRSTRIAKAPNINRSKTAAPEANRMVHLLRAEARCTRWVKKINELDTSQCGLLTLNDLTSRALAGAFHNIV
jgi:hypothetical protein